MSLKSKVGSFQISTGAVGTLQTISGLGFDKAVAFVKFWWNGRTENANALGNADHYFGTGVTVNAAVSYEDFCVTTRSQNGISPSNSCSDTWEARCIAMLDLTTNTVKGAAYCVNYTKDSFDVYIAEVFLSGITVHYEAFGGTDLFALETLKTTEPVSPGNVDMNFSFRPDFLWSISNPAGALGTAPTDDSRMCIGAASFRDGGIQQFVCAYGSNDNVATTDTESYNRSDKFIAHINSAFTGNLTGQASISAISGNKVTLNWDVTQGGGVREHIVLAVRGGSWRVGKFDTVVAVAPIVIGSLGFGPIGATFVSTTQAQSANNVTDSRDERVLGAFDAASNQRSLSIEDSTALATSRISTVVQFDSVYASCNGSAGPSIDVRATLTSIQKNGFTLSQTDSYDSGRVVYYVAFGKNGISSRNLVPWM
jgi:hypothetical protein